MSSRTQGTPPESIDATGRTGQNAMMALAPISDALGAVGRCARPLPAVRLSLEESLGLTLAEAVPAEVGVRLEAQRISIKPGKPTVFGIRPQGQKVEPPATIPAVLEQPLSR